MTSLSLGTVYLHWVIEGYRIGMNRQRATAYAERKLHQHCKDNDIKTGQLIIPTQWGYTQKEQGAKPDGTHITLKIDQDWLTFPVATETQPDAQDLMLKAQQSGCLIGAHLIDGQITEVWMAL
ncbi:hypothetical protein [Deinococcus misasensis]|uniref:hypothetical protein n=1 Tax=Deinococcus misasensis TaxID=392413 RepID=UPI0005572020|nr:hypothetical protein [Deinococcus misasensis]